MARGCNGRGRFVLIITNAWSGLLGREPVVTTRIRWRGQSSISLTEPITRLPPFQAKGVIAIENHDFPAAYWLANPNGDFEHSGAVGLGSFNTKTGIDLEIPLGSIPPASSTSNILSLSHRDSARLYGLGQNNDHITLLDAFGGMGFSAPGSPHENWHAQEAIVSRRHFFERDPSVTKATVVIDGLFEWCQQNPVQEISRFEGNKWLGTEISATSDALEDIPLFSSDTATISLSPVVTNCGGELPLKTMSLKSDYHLTFQFMGEPPTLSEAVDEQIVPVRDFLSLLMGFRAEILSISLTLAEDGSPIKVYIPFVEANHEDLPKHAKREMPFTFLKVKDKLQPMLENWFSLPDDARRAAGILLSMLSNERSLYFDSKFIAAACAFEALSRVGHNVNELPPERFNENLDVIKRSISNARIRKWALYKLKCANSTPAGVLTQKMLDELEPYASHVIPDRQRFETDHRLARNAYVHQNGNLVNGTVPSGQDLRTHTEAVLFLVWGKLLNILGITLQELIDALRSSFFHWNDLHRTQKMYAKKQEEGGSSCDSASPTDSVE